MYKKTIVFDFDGVIHSYKSGWQGELIIPDEPVIGIKETIDELRKDYKVVIVSTRCRTLAGIFAMQEWLEKYDINYDEILKEKPPAVVYIDDRAIKFEGKTEGLVNKIKYFSNWLENPKTKQVVVSGPEMFSPLLTPKWTVEYYKRKGVDVFTYIADIIDDKLVYELADPNTLDDNHEVYTVLFSIKNVGQIFEEIDENYNYLISPWDMFDDREDPILIEIAKEINNEELIKIVEIPADVEYDVIESDCSFSEYVAEKRRVWS